MVYLLASNIIEMEVDLVDEDKLTNPRLQIML
jgi:hypothetical protein